MCGIAGIISLTNDQIAAKDIIKAADTIAHRGPDGDGFLFAGSFGAEEIEASKTSQHKRFIFQIPSERKVALAHRRLSIIDLTDIAFQPMSDNTQQYWVVFNGEIYNHAEIRKELEALNYPFKTDHSDTEMILYAFKEWGIDCIHKFRGMFAICLWDKAKDEFYFVRDRIGVKPLYYTVHDGKFYFASEIKAIIEDKNIPRELNVTGFYDYFSFLTVPAPNTLFKDIYKLKPGHYFKISKGQVGEQTEYWDIYDNVVMKKEEDEEEIKKDLINQLRTSVKYRLEADVPVGVFLSGGVDSSLNTALFSEIAKTRVKAFSIGYENDDQLQSYKNEYVYSRKVAEKFDCDYTEQSLTQKDLLDFLPEMIRFQDEPIGDPVCVPVYYVSKLAREHDVTVAQVGEGSDELFWGYHYWKQSLYAQNISDYIPRPFKQAGQFILKALGKQNSFAYELVRRSASKENEIFWGSITSFGEEEKQALMGPTIKKTLSQYSSWQAIAPYYAKFNYSTKEQAHLNWMSYFDLKLRIPELLLMRVDKMSMAVALEARVPFLDHKFVEYAMGIPAKLKTKNGVSKYILKKAVEGILPHEVIYRKKQGFGAPVYDWFLDELGELAKKEIYAFVEDTQLLNKDMIDHYFETKQGTKIWYILNLVMWHKLYIR